MSKKNISILLFILVLFLQTSFAQKKSGVLIYEMKVVNGYSWQDKLADYNVNEKDSLAIKDAKQQIEKFLASKKNNTNETISQKWEYHFNAKKARIKGNNLFRRKSFDIYEYDSNERIARRFHKGNKNDLRIDTIRYADKLKNWMYKSVIHKDSIKYIRGYKCYKIVIEESKKKPKETLKTTYEIYVTDDINFPLNPIIALPIKVTKDCPVSIKSWVNEEKRNYNKYTLVAYRPKLRRKSLRIPKQYRKKISQF